MLLSTAASRPSANIRSRGQSSSIPSSSMIISEMPWMKLSIVWASVMRFCWVVRRMSTDTWRQAINKATRATRIWPKAPITPSPNAPIASQLRLR